jgi:hypothetical protein
MNTIQIPKQLMEFNKMTVDNTFNAVLALQDQAQRVACGIVEKNPWLPEEGKKAVTDWMKAYKKGVEGVKAATDESYRMMFNFFANGEEAISKAQKNAEKS